MKDPTTKAPASNQVLTQLGQALVSGSLTDERLLEETSRQAQVSILPDSNVVKIGGQSLIDRGRSAVFPVIERDRREPARPQDDHRDRSGDAGAARL